jgi:hypothetical protein
VAERRGGQVAHREERRVARRLDRTPEGDGVYRRDEGAGRADGCPFLPARGGLARWAEVHGMGIQRLLVPAVPSVVRDGLTTGCGLDRLQALSAVWGREAARRLRVGCQAPPVR